jgi:predicted O-methyltransferase YrrM
MDELIKNWINEINLNDWSQLKKKIQNFPNLECSTSDADCFFLALLVKKFRPINILEIGTFVGKSTYSIACAAKDNKLKFNIDTVDIQKKVIKNKFRKFRQIKFHNGHSSQILPKLKKKYDLIFIDANHMIGSIMVLIKHEKLGTILYTGDFRF